MRVLVTGPHGFIGKNLIVRLKEQAGIETLQFARGDSEESLQTLVHRADAIIHLAGENRPADTAAFARVNAGLTQTLCTAIAASGRKSPLILASSIQADLPNPYGESKRAAELAVEQLAAEHANPAVIFRLPNVFGKWCKPNYNSVVATFCHNIANDLPVHINDPSTKLRLVYVDDVVSAFLRVIESATPGLRRSAIEPEYSITLGELAAQIEAFRNCRTNLVSERVGIGLTRALYATYVSYLPTAKFAYDLPCHRDARGVFVEMLKTPDCGQFSFFTALPGVTRGGHYHHSKTEKFLVIRGSARFRFRHMVTNEVFELLTSGVQPQVVETVPGWTHDITNMGTEEMIVMLWANEIFDRTRPDTVSSKV